MSPFLSFFVLLIGTQTLLLFESVITTETDLRDYSIKFERLDHFPTEKINTLDIGTLRVRRRKQTTFVEGNFSVLSDLNNSLTVEIMTEYSPRGNSAFLKYPIHVIKTPFCEYMNKIHSTYLKEGLTENSTNLGQECPIVKGNYWYKNVSDFKDFPQHIPHGLWRLTSTFRRNGQITDQLQFYGRVLEKY